jgi:hypothetical protein
METLSNMVCLGIHQNVIHRFMVQALQDPPLCSSTASVTLSRPITPPQHILWFLLGLSLTLGGEASISLNGPRFQKLPTKGGGGYLPTRTYEMVIQYCLISSCIVGITTKF